MENKYNVEDTERLDALDELIVSELGEQQRLRLMMQAWETRKRTARRLRLVPIISNILSVAALMTIGFILQALMPDMNVGAVSATEDECHQMIENVTGTSTNETSPQVLPADSMISE